MVWSSDAIITLITFRPGACRVTGMARCLVRRARRPPTSNVTSNSPSNGKVLTLYITCYYSMIYYMYIDRRGIVQSCRETFYI